MPVYNVRMATVGLIRAEDEDSAIVKMMRIIDGCGLSVFRDGDDENEPRAFESENVPDWFVL